VSLEPGDVITLPEYAYKYGTGPLTLRVTRVRRDLIALYDGEWVWVNGHAIYGPSMESEERSVLVLIAALPGGAA
jgi:hypothetical protein